MGHTGVGWGEVCHALMGWGGSCRGGVGHAGIGWVMLGWGGLWRICKKIVKVVNFEFSMTDPPL